MFWKPTRFLMGNVEECCKLDCHCKTASGAGSAKVGSVRINDF